MKTLLSPLLFYLYRFYRARLRNGIIRLVIKLEKGEVYSETLRKIFKVYHGVEVGKYSHGSCFIPFAFDRETTVGRYCSIAAAVRVFNRNHPMHFKSTHAFFFNANMEFIEKDLVEYKPLRIGNDVWIGHGAIILPTVTEIGDGAVIGAGSIVSKNVPPYAIVLGYPARVVRYRFSKEIIEKLLEEKWWKKEIEDLQDKKGEFCMDYTDYLNNKRDVQDHKDPISN